MQALMCLDSAWAGATPEAALGPHAALHAGRPFSCGSAPDIFTNQSALELEQGSATAAKKLTRHDTLASFNESRAALALRLTATKDCISAPTKSACKLPLVSVAGHRNDIEVQPLGWIAGGYELDFTEIFLADGLTGVVVTCGFEHPQAAIVTVIA